MLVLSRIPGETIWIGDQIQIKLLTVHGERVRLGVEAPKEVPVYRNEIYQVIQKERNSHDRRD